MAFKIPNPKKEKNSFDVTSYILSYEQGELSDKETIKLFQHLENTGMAYTLQGHYGRVSTSLIGAGLIKPNPKIHSKEQVRKLKEKHKIKQIF